MIRLGGEPKHSPTSGRVVLLGACKGQNKPPQRVPGCFPSASETMLQLNLESILTKRIQ